MALEVTTLFVALCSPEVPPTELCKRWLLGKDRCLGWSRSQVEVGSRHLPLALPWLLGDILQWLFRMMIHFKIKSRLLCFLFYSFELSPPCSSKHPSNLCVLLGLGRRICSITPSYICNNVMLILTLRRLFLLEP